MVPDMMPHKLRLLSVVNCMHVMVTHVFMVMVHMLVVMVVMFHRFMMVVLMLVLHGLIPPLHSILFLSALFNL